jgi:hypothetical protein
LIHKYVRFTDNVSYAPYTLIVKGEVGRLLGTVQGMPIIRLVKHHPGLESDNGHNEVTLSLEDTDHIVPCMSPCALKNAMMAVATGVTACLLLVITPRVKVEPPKVGAVSLERLYLMDGPEETTRVIKQLDGTYALITYTRPWPGTFYLEIKASRVITAAEVEVVLSRLDIDTKE